VLRAETKDAGVRVCCVHPGATWSPSWNKSGVKPQRIMPAEDIARAILDVYRLSRRTVVEEIVLPAAAGRPVGAGPHTSRWKKFRPRFFFAAKIFRERTHRPGGAVARAMTTVHAYSFLLLGGVLRLLPLVSPTQFPPDSLDGANTSALWLQFMGLVNGGIGTVYLWLLEMLPFVVHVMAWRPAPLPDLIPAKILRPALNLDAGGYSRAKTSKARRPSGFRPRPGSWGRPPTSWQGG